MSERNEFFCECLQPQTSEGMTPFCTTCGLAIWELSGASEGDAGYPLPEEFPDDGEQDYSEEDVIT